MLKLTETIPHNVNSTTEMPERILWLAVVERALKDYCFFFDRITSANNGDTAMHVFLDFRRHKRQYNLKKILAEYDKLTWFLFERSAVPFNLEYICVQLYDDGDSVASCFRAEAKKLLNRHILDSNAETNFADIVKYMRDSSNAPSYQEPIRANAFKTKRFRMPNADS